MGGEDGDLALEPKDGAVDIGNAEPYRDIVAELAGGKIIRAIND